MKQFKLGFGNRSIREQLAICCRVETCISKSPEKHRAAIAHIPAEDIIEEAVQADARVEALRLELRSALHDRNAKVRAARAVTKRRASAILGETMGDPAALLAAGLELEAEKRSVGRPSAPTQLRATATEFEGKVRLAWKRPVRRCVFIVEMTRDPAATKGWKQMAINVRQTCELSGLESGVKHWFRVAANNSHGTGPWAGPVCVRPA